MFYTSGRTSNEAAFAYQLFVRAFGTNNLPDCSNMCHESTSIALAETIGIGKATRQHGRRLRRRADRDHRARTPAPTTRGCSPRWRRPSAAARRSSPSTRCARPGCSASATRRTSSGVLGKGHRAVRPPPAGPDQRRPGAVPGDRPPAGDVGRRGAGQRARPRLHRPAHGAASRSGPSTYAASTGPLVERSTGLSRDQIETAAADVPATRAATVICWAMGITQHRNAVATIKEISNVAFCQGNIGKHGAGLFPVRGHSNVQGDRTMGIWERPPDSFLDALAGEVRLRPAPRARPRHRGQHPGDARRQGQGLHGRRRQLRQRRARHRRGRAGAVAGTALTRADLDQAEPLARGHRRDGADPAHARSHREGPCRPSGRAGRHGRGHRVRRARLARAVAPRRARTCARRSRSSPRSPRRPSATGTASTGRRCATTTG